MSWKTCCAVDFNVLLAEFPCMLWAIILHEYKSLAYKPHFRWNHMMLQYSRSDSLHLVQTPDFAICKAPPPTKIFFMLYSWCDTGGCSSFTNSSPHIAPPIQPKDFELWFFSLKNFISQLYYPVFVCFGSLVLFDIVLFSQQCFLDSNSAI